MKLSNEEANVKICSKSSVLILLLTLTACSGSSPEKLMADAEKLVEKKQFKEATLTLKNVIQDNPSLFEAREMLGLIYLNQGMYVASRKELLRAENSLSDAGKVALAETFLWLEEYESIHDLEVQEEGLSKDQLDIYKAIALVRSESPTKALTIFKNLTSSPYQAEGLLAKAYISTINDDAQSALHTLSSNDTAVDSSTAALQLKASLQIYINDWNSASQTIEKLISHRPADYKFKTQLATALINTGKFKEAKPLVAELLKISPEQAYFNQLKGTIDISEKDFENASIHLDKAIKNGRSNQTTRLFSAIAHYQIENFEQAYQNLSIVIPSLPSDHYAQRLYSSIQLKLGYTQDGINNINNMPDLGQDDLLYIVETSRLLIQKNEINEAKRLIEKIDSKDIDDEKMLKNVGLLKLLTGEGGVSELERNLDSSPDSENSFYMLLMAYIEDDALEKAYELVENRLSGEANSVKRLIAKGFLQQTSGNVDAARITYEALREIAPDNFEAALFFIEQSIKQDKLEDAAQLLKKAIDSYPLSTRLLMRSFQVHQRLGSNEHAITQLKRAQLQSSEAKYGLLYAASLLLDDQYQSVIDYLLEKQQKLSTVPKYWMLLGDSYAKQGKNEDARKAFAKWRIQDPSKSSYIRSLQIEEIEGNYLQAEHLIDEAVKVLGSSIAFELLSTRLKILKGNYKDAKSAYSKLPESAQQTVVGQLIKGRLEMNKGDYEAALTTLQPQYYKAPSTELALLIFSSMSKLKLQERLVDFTTEHLNSAPQDNKVRLLFANYLLTNDAEAAIKQYLYLVNNAEQDSPLVLNNLAWLLNKTGEPSEALMYIAKADKLVPSNPSILSTYGSVLSSLSEHDMAIEKSKSAYLLSKKNAEIGLAHFEVLMNGNKRAEAEQVISEIVPVTVIQEKQIAQLKQQFQF